jgi:L-fucose mutarotase/ribose pyranase (RbsD/FucU family)
MGDGAIGQSIGVGVDAKGLSEKQLADINTSANSWWSMYQPELKAQSDQAVKTTDAIVNLTNVTSVTSAGIQAAVIAGNERLQQVIAAIQASGQSAEAQGRAIYAATQAAGKEMASATAAALAAGDRL